MSNSESKHYGILASLSFLAGAFAGAAAVLLLAPKARRESAERLKGFSSDLKERASTAIGSAREKASSIVSRGRDFLDEKRAVVEAAVDAGKDAYAQGKARAAQP